MQPRNPDIHNAKATVSSKGQVVIPQALRARLGIDAGTEIIFTLRNGICEIKPVKRSIRNFFGQGRMSSAKPLSPKDMDRMIMQSVAELNRPSKPKSRKR